MVVTALAALTAAGQAKKDFDARDMFFSSVEMLDGAKETPAAKPAAGAVKPTPAAKPHVNPVPPKTVKARPSTPDAEAHFAGQKGTLLLGLRYSILLKTPAGMTEVRPDRAFKSGDQIRVSVMGNQRGYLYIIGSGTSGTWTPLFPHPKSDQQSNEIVAGRRYQVPGGEDEYFTFTGEAGEEHLFLLLSKTPVADLDEVINGLARRGTLRAVEARNRVDDEMVGQLRGGVQSRDLEFTKSSNREEDAVYVVNKGAGSVTDARVVVDITLNHQ